MKKVPRRLTNLSTHEEEEAWISKRKISHQAEVTISRHEVTDHGDFSRTFLVLQEQQQGKMRTTEVSDDDASLAWYLSQLLLRWYIARIPSTQGIAGKLTPQHTSHHSFHSGIHQTTPRDEISCER